MEEKDEHIDKPKKKGKRRLVRRTVYVLLVLFVLFDLFLYFFATPVLKNYLQEKIHYKTQGLYRIDFDRISVELGSRRVSLDNFKLIPDTIVYNRLLKKGRAKSAIYQISTSSIELWGTGFYNLFFKRYFKVKELIIRNPVVDLKKIPKTDKNRSKNRDFIHEDLFPMVKPYFDKLELRSIVLENGKFHLNLEKDSLRTTTHYGFVSVQLSDFYLDEKVYLQKERLFYSSDIQISLSDYRIKLADGVHVLMADSLFVSTRESVLKIKSLRIRPEIELPQYLENLKGNYYYINAPEISFRNFNIANLYFNQDIEIQNVIVQSPYIKVINKLFEEKSTGRKKVRDVDFYKFIKDKLSSVKIGNMSFNKANFKLFHVSHHNKPLYTLQNVNLNLYGIYLDEFSRNDKLRILYSRNIRINIGKFTARIKHNSHLLSTGKIKLYTDTRSLHVEDMRIKPIKSKWAGGQLLKVYLNKIDLRGANFYRFYHDKILSASSLVSNSSSVDVHLYKNREKVEGKSSGVVNSLLAEFANKLSIRSINFRKAGFKISSYKKDSLLNSFAGTINIHLNRFLLLNSEKTDKNKLFFSDKFKITLTDYSQILKDHLHLLKVDELYLSNTDSIIKFSNFAIKPQISKHKELIAYKKSKLINLLIEESVIKGIDIAKLYADNDLITQSVTINQPGFELLNFKDADNRIIIGGANADSLAIDSTLRKNTVTEMLSDYFNHINIGELSVHNGFFRFVDIDSLNKRDLVMGGDISVGLKHFDYSNEDSTKLYGIANSKDFNIKLDHFYQKVMDKRYRLNISRVGLSSKDSLLTAETIRFFPTPNTDKSLYNSFIWTIYSPKLEAKGFNAGAFVNQNILDLGSIELINPALVLIREEGKNVQTQKNKKAKQAKQKIPFEKIFVDSIAVVNGNFGIFNDDFDLKDQILKTKFDVRLSSFQVDSNFVKNPLEAIKKINTVVSLDKFHYLLKNSGGFVDFEKFYLNSDKRMIQMDSIDFHKKGLKESDVLGKTTLDALHVSAVKFNNFSFEDLLMQKLLADSVFVLKPDISLIKHGKANGSSKNPLDINLYEKTKKVFKGIGLANIKIDDASFSMKNTGDFNKPPTIFKGLYGSISNLLIDSLSQNDTNKLFNTSDISFKFNDYELDTENKLYKININELGFSTGLKKVYASLFTMNPTLGRDALAKNAKTEVKLLYLKANKLIFNKFDFRSFISQKKIIAGRVDVDEFKLHSYKNKQFPIDSVFKDALPLRHMLNAKNYIKIDSLKINNSVIGIELLGKNSKETGYFDITHLNGLVTDITNDKQLIDKGTVMKINANARIMDEGLLRASFRFPLNSKFGEYYYGGSLDSMPIASFNPLLENLYFVSITSGRIDSMDFTINANDDYAEGEMAFGYHDLTFEIRNQKKTDSLITAKRGLVSMAANSIVKNNNPRRKRGYLKPGRIYSERDVYHPIFYYWTLSVLSGVKSTMGFKSKELKERLKLEKLLKKHNKSKSKKKNKLSRKEKRKHQKEIKKDLEKAIKDEENNEENLPNEENL